MNVVKTGSTIQSLQVGFGILDVIAKEGRPLKFTDILELTNISKSNLYKYLNTFVQLQILYRNKQTGTYVLGSKLIEYGMIASDRENIIDRITPFLEDLNKNSGCSVIFSIWTESGPMVTKMFNNNLGINIGVQIGTILPLTSAAGKVFLAYKEGYIIQDWIEKESKKLHADQLTLLKAEISSIQKKGISFAVEPIVQSVSSLSFPVFNNQKSLIGAVAIVGFTGEIPANEEGKLGKLVLETSKEIYKHLGASS